MALELLVHDQRWPRKESSLSNEFYKRARDIIITITNTDTDKHRITL
jgi:hypothetical protein